MKQAATAWNKDAKFVKEDKTSLIISQPSYDGSASFYYKGIYKNGSKTIICETPSSIAPTKQSHAEQIQKACNSLQGAGGNSLAGDTPAASSAAPSAVAANDAPPSAPAAGQQQGAAQNVGRYRISVNVNVQNITNHANYSGFIGTLTSDRFGRPQTVLSTRKVDVGMGISF